MPSFGVSCSRVWSGAPVFAMYAPWVFASRISLMYREVWCMFIRVAVLNLCLKYCEGRANACLWMRSASGIVHYRIGPMASAGAGVGGLDV